jgi:outer membrane protein OmpA-like peptidoglycan-associated protein
MNRILLLVGLLVSLVGCVVKKPVPPQPFTNADLISEIQQLHLAAQESSRGVVVTLPAIFFGFDSAELKPESREQVTALATILNQPPVVSRKIAIEGHADAIGSKEYNLKLSRNRAAAVLQEMIAGQVQQDRLHSEGFGELRPIAPNRNPDGSDNPEGRVLNRRVEVIIEN